MTKKDLRKIIEDAVMKYKRENGPSISNINIDWVEVVSDCGTDQVLVNNIDIFHILNVMT